MKPGAPPPLSRRHVPRPRLTRLLDEATAQAVVIVGSAGYGKTTLAAAWAADRDGVAWLRVTAATADLAGFAIGLADALSPIVRISRERVRRQLEVSAAPEGLANLFARVLRDWPAEAVLVLDDYHLVEDEKVHELVDALLTNTELRVVVTTRRRPPWASARRLVGDEVAEVGRAALSMTAEEAAQVLPGHRPEAVRALVARSRGWPAVIALASLTAASDVPERAMADALYRYFADEVLSSQPEEVQRFMLEASVATAVTAGADAQAAVERLVDEGLLTREGKAYLFHPLLRRFLRSKLETQDPARWAELLEQAIAAARSEHRWEEAFELAAGADLSDAALEIAREAAVPFVDAGRIDLLERWLAVCGAPAFRHPELVLARLAVLFHRGRFSDAAALAADLAGRVRPGDPTASRAWYRRAQALHMLAEREGAMEAAHRAYETAATPLDRRKGLLLAALTAARLELDEVDGYLRELEQLDAEIDDRLRFAAAVLVARVKGGSLEGVWEQVQPLVVLSEYTESPMLRSHVLACAAYLHILRADYALARRLADEAVEVCREFSIDFAYDICLVYRAFADIGLHQFKEARNGLREAQRRGRTREDPDFHLQQRIAQIKLGLATGHSSGAPPPLEPALESDATRAYVGEHCAYAALAAAVSGDSVRCAAEAARTRRLTGSAEATYYADFAELISGIGGGGDVTSRLVELVGRAERAEVLDAFVVAYRAYPPLLGIAAGDAHVAALARRLTARCGDQALAHDAGLSPAPRAVGRGAAPLTPREHEVLELIAEGLQNAEIAERLVISLSTAKIHVHNILRKLGASSRLEAVLHAGDSAGLAERPADP